MTSHGMPAPVACSSRFRTVWDLPAPVAPHTNTCRFSDGPRHPQGPAGIRAGPAPPRSPPPHLLPAAEPGACSAPQPGSAPPRSRRESSRRHVKSRAQHETHTGYLARRRQGQRGQQRRRAANGASGTGSAGSSPLPGPGAPRISGALAQPGSGCSAYGRSRRSADVHTRPATCAAARGVAAPASRWTCHSPAAALWRSSVSACSERRARSCALGLSYFCPMPSAAEWPGSVPPGRCG